VVEEGRDVEETMVAGVETPVNILFVNRGILDMLRVKKVDFISFIARVMYCTMQNREKSEKNRHHCECACFTGIRDLTAKFVHGILSMKVPPSQAP
jgi:hypothetical protein